MIRYVQVANEDKTVDEYVILDVSDDIDEQFVNNLCPSKLKSVRCYKVQ
jgi:hypothetical protein